MSCQTHSSYAPAAIENLQLAADGYGPAYARSRAVNLPGLAGSYFYRGDVDVCLKAGRHRRARAGVPRFGLNDADARLPHNRSNAVYLLPLERVVARLAPSTPHGQERAATAIAVSRWLNSPADLIALPPVPGDQPLVGGGAVATFWPYRAPTRAPTLADLAGPLRRLHTLPSPPFSAPRFRALHRLGEALDLDTVRERPVL